MHSRFLSRVVCTAALLSVFVAFAGTCFAGKYQSFDVAIYIPVSVVNHFKEPGVLENEWKRISEQLKVDKVYIETTRGREITTAEHVEFVKNFFIQHGVKIAGGMTFESVGSDVYLSYCYTDPKDRQFVKDIVEFTARHFDEIILDDFFFVNTKTPSDIAAKGSRSWTEFRLELMNEVARDLLLAPAKAIKPDLKFVIKFPNWYEHFQGLGFDLEREPKLFDGIYTGTETRDGAITDQHLQQYESYEIIRYFDNIAPGRNGGGWVDTYDIRYVDRYAEQLWNTMFAKAREMTLFEWSDLLNPVEPGARDGWAKQATSFNYDAIAAALKQRGVPVPLMAGMAAHALEQMDALMPKLGKPVGIASYKPHHSMGEDFLHNFIGNLGIPIELYPDFPTEAPVVLLTESAAYDPKIVDRIKGQLDAGRNVVITSGLLRALQDKGLQQIIEARCLEKRALVTGYSFAFGSGAGASLGHGHKPILIPQIQFLTNDTWPLIRGETDGNGFPILLSNQYSRGTIYVLTIPDDPCDLYEYPTEVLTAIKKVLMRDAFVRLDAPAKVVLFTYDNNTFIVENYLGENAAGSVSLPAGYTKLRNLTTGEVIAGAEEPVVAHRGLVFAPRVSFPVKLLPHSFAAFAAEK